MTLQQFRSLAKDQQRKIVQHLGVFLFGKQDGETVVKLYQIDGFYAELYFDLKMSEVIHIISFADTAKLEPYLQLVDVSEI